MSAAAFYDALTPFYHLIHEDRRAGIDRQGAALDARPGRSCRTPAPCPTSSAESEPSRSFSQN
ncbi:uncharacterized protein sS8_4521 [Methylocaldum marinum]|uniref:Uncharacterized protein n=1 Tax=Methylocaldum marinum TaxID=1432792 RepID=A0A250KZP2_9GAMM|nr:uncharacterized protein sS8_4521 [Methylocaldum marinum]